jgi:hypothetical protein
MRSIFNLKKIALNLQIYFRVTIVFFRKLPSIIFIFIHDLPKNLKKEGSEIKIHRRRFELARIWPHLGIAILSCVVISSSVFAQDMGYSNSEFSQNLIEPSEYADFAIAADSYIPFIDAKNNDIILALAEADTVVTSDESYILAPADIATEKSPKESTTPSSRTSYITYQILGGETLSFIGVKFNVTSSSILWLIRILKIPIY